jgi:hypothetical protein
MVHKLALGFEIYAPQRADNDDTSFQLPIVRQCMMAPTDANMASPKLEVPVISKNYAVTASGSLLPKPTPWYREKHAIPQKTVEGRYSLKL